MNKPNDVVVEATIFTVGGKSMECAARSTHETVGNVTIELNTENSEIVYVMDKLAGIGYILYSVKTIDTYGYWKLYHFKLVNSF